MTKTTEPANEEVRDVWVEVGLGLLARMAYIEDWVCWATCLMALASAIAPLH